MMGIELITSCNVGCVEHYDKCILYGTTDGEFDHARYQGDARMGYSGEV